MDRSDFAHRGGSGVNTSKRKLSALFVAAGLMVMPLAMAARAQAQSTNSPWYPSLQAFEHYNSGRSHVFSDGEVRRFVPRAEQRGPRSGPARARTRPATTCLTSNANAAFIQGGSYGDVKNSIGPFVAKVNPKTLKPMWYTQLVNTVQTGEWDYPGGDGHREQRLHLRGVRIPDLQGRSDERESREDPQAADAWSTCAATTPTRRPSMTRPRPRTRSTPRTTVSMRSRTGRSWSSRCTEWLGAR